MKAQCRQCAGRERRHYQRHRPGKDANSDVAVITNAVDDNCSSTDRQSDRWNPSDSSIYRPPLTPRTHVEKRRPLSPRTSANHIPRQAPTRSVSPPGNREVPHSGPVLARIHCPVMRPPTVRCSVASSTTTRSCRARSASVAVSYIRCHQPDTTISTLLGSDIGESATRSSDVRPATAVGPGAGEPSTSFARAMRA